MSSVLLGGPAMTREHVLPSAGMAPPPVHGRPPADAAWQRGNTLTVIAGVGVLLLAMGVGVLIGRSGSSKPSPGAPQVISVASTPAPSAPSPAAAEASFTDDWPAGRAGYTVELQELPQAGTAVSAVEAAKAAASAKGAKALGALKSEDFPSLTPGSYVVYSGVYHKQPEAEKALTALKKSFPGATVIHVASAGAGSSASEGSSPASGSGVGANESHPAPPSVLKSLNTSKGKSYEEKSKNLPNVVETG